MNRPFDRAEAVRRAGSERSVPFTEAPRSRTCRHTALSTHPMPTSMRIKMINWAANGRIQFSANTHGRRAPRTQPLFAAKGVATQAAVGMRVEEVHMRIEKGSFIVLHLPFGGAKRRREKLLKCAVDGRRGQAHAFQPQLK